MSTTRERKERRRDRREEWAESRDRKAEEAHDASTAATAQIPLGQPILVGHHSQRRHERAIDRSQKQASKSVEHRNMAERHRSKADGIARQLDTSIYSDDDDAIEALSERIAKAEASRDRIKRYNASARKGSPDVSLLDEAERADLASSVSVGFARPDGQFPAFTLTNLGGRIRKDKARLEELQAKEEA